MNGMGMAPKRAEIFAYILIAIVVLFIVFMLLKRFGIIKSKTQRDTTKIKQESREEKAETKAEKAQIIELLSDNEYFKPGIWKGIPAKRLYTTEYSRQLATKIKKAFGLLNDKEEVIYAVFRSLKDKANISQIAFAYMALYNTDLLGELIARLSKSELQMIYNIIENI